MSPIKESEEKIEISSVPGSHYKQNQKIFDNFMMVQTPCNDGDNFSSSINPASSSSRPPTSTVVSPDKDITTKGGQVYTPHPSMFTPKPPTEYQADNSVDNASQSNI